MKFGVNTFIWESPFSTQSLDLIKKVKVMGFDVFEVAVEDPHLIDGPALKSALDEAGLSAIICGAFGPDRDISSTEAVIRDNCKTYLRSCIDLAVIVGSPCVCGPMYSAVGNKRLLSADDKAAERARSVAGLREIADYAAERGICLAFETLNRFENDMINTVDQAISLIDEIDRKNVGLHLDTFHMHIEEKDSAAAIRAAGGRLYHFHASENDRGVPGTGQVHWQEVAAALKDIHYQGAVVIESFTPQVTSIAAAVCLWRSWAPDQDTIGREGLKFLKNLLG